MLQERLESTKYPKQQVNLDSSRWLKNDPTAKCKLHSRRTCNPLNQSSNKTVFNSTIHIVKIDGT